MAGSTEEQILDEARKLFNQRGYAGMTLRRIADEVGIEPQTIYNYAVSKQALVDRMMRTAMTRLHARTAGAVAEAGPEPAARLRAAVRVHTEYFCTRDDYFMVVRDALKFLDPGVRDAQLRILRAYEDLFRDIIRDGMATGEFEVVDTTAATYAVMGLGESVVHWFNPSGRLSARQVADEYAHLALKMVGSPRPDPAGPSDG